MKTLKTLGGVMLEGVFFGVLVWVVIFIITFVQVFIRIKLGLI